MGSTNKVAADCLHHALLRAHTHACIIDKTHYHSCLHAWQGIGQYPGVPLTPPPVLRRGSASQGFIGLLLQEPWHPPFTCICIEIAILKLRSGLLCSCLT